MNRRRGGSLAGSPLLIGAITTLIVVVAVYLSYNANNGLPFVPTYNINVELPTTSGLEESNVVRVGGSRVGIVNKLTAHQDPRTGRVSAIAELKLEKGVEALPVDTTASVQSLSSIGLKFLELEKGGSHRTIAAGGTLPLSHVREPVNIEELFNMFDEKTRTAAQINSNEVGAGLAGRGPGLNNTIATLRPLVTNAIPVFRNLAAPQTDLHGLWVALDRVASQSASVADTNAAWYVELDKFFTDWAAVAPSIERATVLGPPSLEQAIHSLPFEAEFNEKQTEFMNLLRPSAALLVSVAPQLAHAFTVGAVNLREATALNPELARSAQAIQAFAENPIVPVSLEDFTQTLQLANPVVGGIAPEQANCNYFTLAFRNLASATAENIGVGTLTRASLVLSPIGPNSEGFPSSAPASGPSAEAVDSNHLHANPYPFVTGPGQPAGNCEAGNENYVIGKTVTSNVPGVNGSAHELTTRQQDLFGEPYPSSTLANLGLAPTKTTGSGK